MNLKKTLILWSMALSFCGMPHLSYAQPIQLTIVDSIQLALTHSPTIKAAEAETAKAEWLLKENHSNYLPIISVNHIQTQNYPGTVDSPSTSRSSFIEAKTTLYSGGLNEGLTAQAKELYTGAQYNLAHTKQQVIANTYLAYYNVLQAEKNVGLAAEAVQRLTQHLATVEAQYAEGIVIKSDVLRTEVELAQAKQNHNKAQNACRLANNHFMTLLGLSADKDITLVDTGTVSAYEGPIDQAIQTALVKRSELKQAYQEKKAASQGMQIAQSGQLPTVNLSIKKDWQNQRASTNPWSAQVAISFNVFDGSKTKAKIKQAEWETAQKHELLQQKTEQVTLETREAYFNMQNARAALDIASQVVAKAEEDYTIAQVRYQAGIGINLDVIDSQGALTSAKLNYINACYDYNKYIIQLAQAMGTITEVDIHAKQETTR
ncbi:TolC family protein [Pelosinus sp. sgz500959]|uniref:TolC family protein n=1 Tax=Pelosinus sp. sgz500959 TaxID=3242472 RepID=UPI00366B3382